MAKKHSNVCLTQLIRIQIEKTLDSFYLSYTVKKR
jgi:hypothetical protein